jgi:hypothetical protein
MATHAKPTPKPSITLTILSRQKRQAQENANNQPKEIKRIWFG